MSEMKVEHLRGIQRLADVMSDQVDDLFDMIESLRRYHEDGDEVGTSIHLNEMLMYLEADADRHKRLYDDIIQKVRDIKN